MYRRLVAIASVAGAWSPSVHAGGLDADLLSPRAIARAGATTVSEDGASALLRNPAGMVRRGGTRVQLSITLHDRDASYRASDQQTANSPDITDRGGARALPMLGFQYGARRLVVGASYADTGNLARSLPQQSVGQPPGDVIRLFPHRYGGVGLRYRRRVFAVGAAVRVTDWLGLGISASAARIELGDTRAVWAGFDGRDNIDDPSRDLRLATDASDGFVPAAAAGLLAAPPHMPMELAISATASDRANLSGDATLTPVTTMEFPAVDVRAPSAAATMGRTVRVHAGMRYLGDRITAEVAGELVFVRGDYLSPWTIAGVTAVDQTGQTGPLSEAPALVALRDHGAVRSAVDVEVVRGFLWLTGGYGFRTTATSRNRVTPVFGHLGAHTFAAGAETHWRDMTLTLGYARTVSVAETVVQSAVSSVNPFAAGTRPAGLGTYDRAEDTFGLAIDMSW